jgi:hypothetical protein
MKLNICLNVRKTGLKGAGKLPDLLQRPAKTPLSVVRPVRVNGKAFLCLV